MANLRERFPVMTDAEFAAAVDGVQRRQHWWPFSVEFRDSQGEDMQAEKFNEWAVVEVMGHRQFAGLVTEQAIGGASFVRVDVPAVQVDGETLPAFTKVLGAGSIYAITPCTEETARAFAQQSRQRAFATYEAPRLTGPTVDRDDDEDDDLDDGADYEPLDEADII